MDVIYGAFTSFLRPTKFEKKSDFTPLRSERPRKLKTNRGGVVDRYVHGFTKKERSHFRLFAVFPLREV